MGHGLKLSSVSYSYPFSGRGTPALSGVSLELASREVVCVAGPNGSGKSTLALVCAGLLDPDEGTVSYAGEEVNSRRDRLGLRRKVGLLFQSPEDQLFADTVYKDIAFGPRNHGVRGAELDKRVSRAASTVGLDLDRLGSASPFSLSAGERRRTAIAGVLAMGVDVLVLDEPFVGLDHEGARMLASSLRRFVSEEDGSALVITHDLSSAWRIADRFLFLRGGTVTREAGADAVSAGELDLSDTGVLEPQLSSLFRGLVDMGFRPSSAEPADLARALADARGRDDVR